MGAAINLRLSIIASYSVEHLIKQSTKNNFSRKVLREGFPWFLPNTPCKTFLFLLY